MTDVKNRLYEPFKTIDSRRGRGGVYDYIKWQAVVDRMNEIFGIHWTSHVENQETLNGSIVIRVSVCVKDPDSGEIFCQEGFGGSVLHDGDEPASAHKGAYSKALKDACKKWGVGLHLEEDTQTQTKPIMPNEYTGYETAKPNLIPPVETPVVPMPPSTPVETIATNTMPSPPNTVVQPEVITPVAPTPSVVPVETPVLPTSGVQQMPPTVQVTPDMGLPPTPPPIGANQPLQNNSVPVNSPPSTNDGALDVNASGSITNVQEMAIKNLARLNGIEGQSIGEFLNGLVSNPKCELNRQVNSLNDLSYNEAVYVIKASKSL